MKKFFAIIFLLAAAYLTFEIVTSIYYAYDAGFSTRYMSGPSYLTFVLVFMGFGAIIFLLTWLGLKWLKKPARLRSNAIDDQLIENQ